MRAIDRTSGKDLASDLSVAESILSRTRGLLGRTSLAPGEGLLLRPCTGVHTFFMKFPIDVVFLDRDNRVIEVVQHLKPHRITRIVLSSASVIELPAGTAPATGTVAGNEIHFDPRR